MTEWRGAPPPLLLLADSDDEFRQRLRALLEEEGCEVEEAREYEEAMQVLNSQPIDKIVAALDLRHANDPNIVCGGLDLAECEERRDIPVYLIGDQLEWNTVRRAIRGHLVDDWVPRSEGAESVLRCIMPSPIILHISDLQFGPYQREMMVSPSSRTIVPMAVHIEKIRHDLAERLRLKPNVLVVSGDISEYGFPDQFGVAGDFLKQLARSLGLPTQRIVITPGNHDICWPDARAALEKVVYAKSGRLLDSCEDRQELLDAILDEDTLFQKFAEYEKFYSGLYEDRRRFGRRLYDVFYFPGLNVLIASLNSCVRACHLASQGWIGNDQVLSAGEEMDRLDPGRRCVRIGVFHHHVFPKNKQDFDDRVEDFDKIRPALEKCDFRILMHGHQHKSDAYRVEPIGGRPLFVLATGSLLLRREKTILGNQYQVLELKSPPRKSRLYLRRYDPHRPSSSGIGDGEWVPDTSYSYADDAGVVEFSGE